MQQVVPHDHDPSYEVVVHEWGFACVWFLKQHTQTRPEFSPGLGSRPGAVGAKIALSAPAMAARMSLGGEDASRVRVYCRIRPGGEDDGESRSAWYVALEAHSPRGATTFGLTVLRTSMELTAHAAVWSVIPAAPSPSRKALHQSGEFCTI